jgi:hypothetical protein
MTAIIEVLVSPAFFLAIVVYSLASIIVSMLEIRLHDALQEVTLSHWLATHFGFPLLHSLAMILFVAIIYTHLYGLEDPAPLKELISAGDDRIRYMVNWVFIFAFFIPMIPLLGPRLDIILPVQGLVVVFILGDWQAQYLGLEELKIIPSSSYILPILVTGILASIITTLTTHRLGYLINERYNLSHSELVIYPVLAMAIHTPTLTLFAQGLLANTITTT